MSCERYYCHGLHAKKLSAKCSCPLTHLSGLAFQGLLWLVYQLWHAALRCAVLDAHGALELPPLESKPASSTHRMF